MAPKTVAQKLAELENRLDAVDRVAVLAARTADGLRTALGAFRRNVRTELEALKRRLGDVENTPRPPEV